MAFNSLEDAYNALASYLLAFIDGRDWDEAQCQMRILSEMARGSQWLKYQGNILEKSGFQTNQEAIWGGLDAALYIRDELLKSNGNRIWGLIFTLHPDGKFNIAYDYNKPDHYEESDELMEINEALKVLPFSSNSKKSIS